MFKKSLLDYVGSILIGLSTIVAQPACVSAGDKKTTETTIDDLTIEEVDKLMLRSNVDEILKEEYSSGRIQKVTYDSSTGRTNFRELVYQEHLPANERKPVIMLVADGDGEGGLRKDRYCADKGDAIVVKHLANKYKQFKIVTYDSSIVPDSQEGSGGKAKFGLELKGESITTSPSVLIYGINGDNEFRRLYLFKGGPLNPDANAKVLKAKIIIESELDKLNLNFNQ